MPSGDMIRLGKKRENKRSELDCIYYGLEYLETEKQECNIFYNEWS